MASRDRKLRAGLFAIGAAALVALAVLAFGGRYALRGGDTYYVEYEDTVYGLEDGANVYMSGVRVGTVDHLAVVPEDPRRVRVRIVVRAGAPVRADTRAMLQFTGITGLKVIDLRGGSPEAPPLPPGSTIPPGETSLDRLERNATRLAEQSIELLTRANRVLAQLGAVADPAGEAIEIARRAATDLAAAGATLREIAGENRAAIRQTIEDVGRSARAAQALLDGRGARIAADAGDVVAGLEVLVRDGGATLRAMLFDLRQASRSLRDLAREVRQRPSRLLFSDPPPERRLP